MRLSRVPVVCLGSQAHLVTVTLTTFIKVYGSNHAHVCCVVRAAEPMTGKFNVFVEPALYICSFCRINTETPPLEKRGSEHSWCLGRPHKNTPAARGVCLFHSFPYLVCGNIPGGAKLVAVDDQSALIAIIAHFAGNHLDGHTDFYGGVVNIGQLSGDHRSLV